MSASLDVDVLLRACELSRLPADHLDAFKRIVAKLEAGFLGADDLNAALANIREGVVTFEEGLASLAIAQ